jgi:hypothetical protein
MQTYYPSSIREEELKNRVATAYFDKYDCDRIVGNIDFCVVAKTVGRDAPPCRSGDGNGIAHGRARPLDAPLFWAEAKNHPTDVHRMLAQLILTIGRVGRSRFADAARPEAAPYQAELDLEGSDLCSTESAALPLRLCVEDNLSPVARAVMDAGRELWRYYHEQPNANPNASYYDIRLHFQGVKRTASGKEQMNATSSDAKYNELLAALRAAHKALAAQIAPKVYEYGFLKR